MSKRINVMIDDDAYDMLMTMADSVNKRGKLIGGLIRAAYESGQANAAVDAETLRLQLAGLAGTVRQLEGRVVTVEAQLAALIARES